MKVQTKILLLLLAIGALYGGGLTAVRMRERTRFLRVSEERRLDREKSFDEFLQRRSEGLQTYAKDASAMSALVEAIEGEERGWVENNLNGNVLNSYNADAAWICRTDHTVFYSLNRLYADGDLDALPLPPGAFDALARRRLMHFYLPVKEGLMEISAATVHPSNDPQRQTPVRGFFFVGRLWSNELVRALANDTDNTLRLEPATLANGRVTENEIDCGTLTFTRTLANWDGKPAARLIVSNDSKIIRELNSSNKQLLTLLIVFAALTFGLLAVSLMRWVSRPLHLLSRTLESEQLGPSDKLRDDGSEFGRLAQMIREFFMQRTNLLAEIAERKQAQEALRESGEQLRQSQKMEAVGRLAGGVAHDFNNLLTAILGYAELLALRRDLDPSARQNVETIQKAGRQAAAVTHQLLAFSRKQVLQPRVIDLNALIHDFEKILRRVIGEHIELHQGPRAARARVRADPNQIEQVILNLGVNARDAMSKGGQLTISTANVYFNAAEAHRHAVDIGAGAYILLTVSDTGHGMDEETQTRIFEPFFTTKGPGKGTGLGLATVYGVVKQSGGAICVDSAPGEGCTFRIYLPLEEAALEEDRPKTVVPVGRSTRQAETVLVVEDEEIVRQLVCAVLTEQGYDVLCAAHGQEALQISGEHRGKIALMITDVVMPQIGGLELAREITLRRPETRVLYVSGYSEADMSEQGVQPEELEFLEKPFTPQALTRKVREILNPTAAMAGQGNGA